MYQYENTILQRFVINTGIYSDELLLIINQYYIMVYIIYSIFK